MSSTRINTNGDFKQERWASSPALSRGLKANLVAARVSVLRSREHRAAVWFLQYLSLRPGGLAWAAAELAPDKLDALDRERWLASLCLDPESGAELEALLPRLNQFMADYARLKADAAVTEIGKGVRLGLEYCSQARGLVLISGKPRLGKTWAAQSWIEQNAGRARYFQVPSSGDDTTFFAALARAVGVAVESNVKAKYLLPRLEQALQGGDLVLVCDESANIWPNYSYRMTRPARITWIMTALVNHGVPVALLVTPQFFNAQADYIQKTGWASAQWDGRICRFIQLPDQLSIQDIEAVARVWLPHGDRRSIQTLADMAFLSNRGLAAIEHSVKLAEFIAREDGRSQPEWQDIQRAIKTGALPSESNLTAALSGAAVRKAPAISPRQ